MNTPTLPAATSRHAQFIRDRLPEWVKHSTADDFARLRRFFLGAQNQAERQPAWFSDAPQARQQALLASQAASRTSARALAQALKGLQGITEFSEPRLRARLQATHQVEIDVSRNNLVQFQPGANNLLDPDIIQYTLLQAALQNFDKDTRFDKRSALAPVDAFALTVVPGASEDSLPSVSFGFASTLSVTPQAFAALCHELDLGGQYQAHLAQIYESPTTREVLGRAWMTATADRLQVNSHVALLRNWISETAHARLLQLIAQARAGQHVRFSQLQMFGIALSDVLVLGPDRDSSQQVEPVSLYLPGVPGAVLKEYGSVALLKADLRERLRDTAFVDDFIRFVPQADRQTFRHRLKLNLQTTVTGADGLRWTINDPQANLHLRETVVHAPLFAALYTQHVARIKADARVLAVPSAEVDEQLRHSRIAYWQSLGLNLLNVAAFFVPGLGEVMAVVQGVQLIEDVFEGAHDWGDGDKAQALAHLQSVALNVALAVGLLVGAKVVAPSPKVVDELVEVSLPDGQQRLWRPGLEGYETQVPIAPESPPDEFGQHTYAGRRYWRRDGKHYQQSHQDPQRIAHPREPNAYQPQVQHYGQGAWQVQGDNPLAWSRRQLLQHLGGAAHGLDELELEYALKASGVSEQSLLQVHVQGTEAPMALSDILDHLQDERKVEGAIVAIGEGRSLSAETSYHLNYLEQIEGWPKTHVLERFQSPQLSGNSTVYGVVNADSVLLKVSDDEILEGKLAQAIQREMQPTTFRQMMGSSVETGNALQVLRARMVETLQVNRTEILLGMRADRTLEPPLQRLKDRFPYLPNRSVEALYRQATRREALQLSDLDQPIPLRLAEQAQVLNSQARVSQAIEGVCRPALHGDDSDRLALRLLEFLPGWPDDLRLELRVGSTSGVQLETVGPATASEVKYLVREAGGIRAYDGNGLSLNNLPGKGEHNLFASILKALPDRARLSMALQIHDSQVLGARLAELALADHPRVARIISTPAVHPWFRPGLGLRGGGSAVGRLRTDVNLRSRVRQLYPQMNDERASHYLSQLQREVGIEQLQARVAQLERDYQALDQNLTAWAGTHRDHLEAARRIRSCWQRQEPPLSFGRAPRQRMGLHLSLSELELQSLPTLGCQMDSVLHLELDSVQLGSLPPGFLASFPELDTLSLPNTNLTTVPEEITRLTELSTLDLSSNRLNLDAQAYTRLAALPRLENLYMSECELDSARLLHVLSTRRQLRSVSLNSNRIVLDAMDVEVLAGFTRLRELFLSDNPLTRAPDVSGMSRLRILGLIGTEISAWPRGLEHLSHLENVYLQRNRITTLPELWLAATNRTRAAAIGLEGNPLDMPSSDRLLEFIDEQQLQTDGQAGDLEGGVVDFGIERMDLIQAIATGGWGPVVGIPAEADFLLSGVSDVRRAQWQQLKAEQRSGPLFVIIERLGSTADAQQVPQVLRNRAWTLLDAASESQALRQRLFEVAEQPRCRDAVIAQFALLEEEVLLFRAEARVANGQAEGAELLGLARGLFQRGVLAEYASRLPGGEQIEGYLALCIRFESEFNLPPVARTMLYADVSGLTEAHYRAARTLLQSEFDGPLMVQSISDRTFWQSYLRNRHPARFSTLSDRFAERQEALDVDAPDYGQQANNLRDTYEAAEQDLLVQLTREQMGLATDEQ